MRVEADTVRLWLLQELGTELRSIDHKFNLLKHRDRGDYKPVPYQTRFNDVSRAESVLNGFQEAVSRATERYDVGTFLTLTVDPKRFDSHADATDALFNNKDRLMAWLSTDSRLGYRPVNISVLEFMDKGMPHLHICLFGVTSSELPSQDTVRQYWDERRNVGSQVHLKDIRRRNRDDRFLLRDTSDGDTTDVELQDYLTDAMYDLIRVAGSNPDDLFGRASEGDVSELWKQALYWYTERRYWSGSPSLTDDGNADDFDGLPHVPEWEYVGTFRASDIPARILRCSGNDRPPP
jgi:hypothetical protein